MALTIFVVYLSHIVKDVFRNTLPGYADTVMELACGLHNFRSYCRLEVY